MPTYVYRRKQDKNGCKHCIDGFEAIQLMRDAPIEKCPECGGAVERVIAPVNIVRSDKSVLTDKNLKRHGFHRLVKEEKGRYRKTT